MRATKDFGRIANSWSYEDGVNDLHDEYHKYHLRNYIPRVVSEYKKILNNPKLAAYTRCIPIHEGNTLDDTSMWTDSGEGRMAPR